MPNSKGPAPGLGFHSKHENQVVEEVVAVVVGFFFMPPRGKTNKGRNFHLLSSGKTLFIYLRPAEDAHKSEFKIYTGAPHFWVKPPRQFT